MESMSSESSLPTCSICMDIFTDPRIISCGHSFCYQCCQSNFYAAENRDCPLCKNVIELPERCGDLIKNWELKKMSQNKNTRDDNADGLSKEVLTMEDKLVNLKTKCNMCEKLFPAMDIYSCADHNCDDICGVCCMRFHKGCSTMSLGLELFAMYESQMKTGQRLKGHFEAFEEKIDQMLIHHASCISQFEELCDQLKLGERFYSSKINKINQFREGIDGAVCENQNVSSIKEMVAAANRFYDDELKTYKDEENDLEEIRKTFEHLWEKVNNEIQTFQNALEIAHVRNLSRKSKQVTDESEKETKQMEENKEETVLNDPSGDDLKHNFFSRKVAPKIRNFRKSTRRSPKHK